MQNATDPSFWEQISAAFTFDTLYAWHVWLMVAVGAAILEMMTPGFVLLCLSFGALGAASTDLLGFHDFKMQIAIFGIVTFLSFFALRPLLQRWLTPKVAATNVDGLVGKVCRVTKAAAIGGVGSVRIGAEEWRAESTCDAELILDSRVKVARVEGNRVTVDAVA